MNLLNILIIGAIVCVLWALVSLVLLTAALERRGIRTPFPFMGALLFRNFSRYKELTRKETGKVGKLYYSYIVPINAALILFIVLLLMRSAR